MNINMTNFKTQHRPFPKLWVGFYCVFLPSCTQGGILRCCKSSRPCANFCKTPVMNCVGVVLVPNDGAMQYQSQSCLCVGQAEGFSVTCLICNLYRKKHERGGLGFWSVIPHACGHNAFLPQQYSGLHKYYKVCGFQSSLLFGVSFPPGSHSSGGLFIRLNGSFMGTGTGESQTLPGSFHHIFKLLLTQGSSHGYFTLGIFSHISLSACRGMHVCVWPCVAGLMHVFSLLLTGHHPYLFIPHSRF